MNITGTDAGETIQGTAGDDVIDGLGGDDVISGGGGSDILHGGEGNDRLREVTSGSKSEYHQMFGDAGDDVLEFDLRSSYADTVLLDGGIGNDRIIFDAWHPLHALSIAGGDGNDFIHIAGGRSVTVDGGSGVDRIELEYNNTATSYSFTFGSGSDILDLSRVWTLTSIGAPIHITDFEAGAAGDRIVLDRLLMTLAGWDRVSNPFASGHLALVQRGADAVLQINLNGNGARDLFILEGVSTAALTDRNLGLAPGGGAAAPVAADGGTGADFLYGSGGNDLLRGFDGADELFGGLGNDRLEGGLGADVLEGGFGDDVLLGEQGNDKLIDFDAGNDQLLGGEGNDSLEVIRSYREPAGTIVLDGGAGDDRLDFSISPYFQRRGRIDHVSFIGGDGNDNIRAEGAGVVDVDAGAGADQVDVAIDGTTNFVSLGSGADILKLGAEATKEIVAVVVRDFEAGNGGDRLDIQSYLRYALTGWNPLNNPFEYGYLQVIQRGADAVLQIDVDGAGSNAPDPIVMVDLVVFRNIAATSLTTLNLGGYASLTGTEGNDVIEGDSGNNTLRGLGGNDTLNGNDGDDFLDGGAGDDVMSGGFGADIYIVDQAGDQVIEVSEFVSFGGDEVRTSLPVYAMPAYVERLVGTSSTGQTLTSQGGVILGGTGNDIITAGGSGNAVGGSGDDLVKGSANNNILVGGAGSDILYGYGGDDSLYAGNELTAAFGNDYLDGGDGNDHLRGSSGDDILIGGIGDDDLYDNASGSDQFDGGEGNDDLLLTRFSYGPVTVGTISLLGGSGDDAISLVVDNASTVIIDGGDGNDEVRFSIFAGIGTVTLGAGADVIYFSDYLPQVNPNGRITVTDFDLGPGGDTLSWTAFLQAWLIGWAPAVNPFLSGHVRLGQSGTSTVLQLDRDGGGDDFATLLTFQNTDPANFTAAHLGYAPLGQLAQVGGFGNDTMAGGAGNDIIDGGAGDDIIEGRGGNDTLAGSEGDDSIDGGDGLDRISGGAGHDVANGGTGADDMTGDGGQDWLIGGAGADSISGGDGDDSVWGGDEDDMLRGGAGDDTIVGGAGIDTVTYADAQAGVEIDLSFTEEQLTRGAGVDTLLSIENLIGSNFADVLAGDAGANRLTGGDGDDRFVFNGLGPRDTITDFSKGDLIDLSAIDANGLLSGEGAFAFIGAAAFGGVAGQLRVTGSGLNWVVEADTNGDGAADFGITVATLATGMWFAGSDFLL